jgi:glycogen debranching enzyme
MKQALKPISFPESLRPILPPQLALRRVVSKSGKGVYASSDTLYRGAVFGRDSIEVAEDLLSLRRGLISRIILTLASLQGETDNAANEEEPGKIVHEYRTTVVDGKPIKGNLKGIFEELSERWGGTQTQLVYYGSVDSTPHFLRLLGNYCQRYGPRILKQKVSLRSGHTITIAIAAENAADWLLQKIGSSQVDMVEYLRKNSLGVLNQAWKDSNEFYVHNDGTAVNHKKPIASIEVQGLAYDALLAVAELLPNNKEKYLEAAKKLRERILELLWLPEEEYFGLGIDYDNDDLPRIIRTPSANAAALLDTRLFDDLQEGKKRLFISGIAKKMMSPEFLTDAGIRSRSLTKANLVPYWDYHGSYVTWPKETYDIAKGFERQGFPNLARELENRLLNIVLKNRDYPEFVYVDEWGRVLSSRPETKKHADVTYVDSTNNPERTQAWTVSAIMAIVASRLRSSVKLRAAKAPNTWQSQLEKQLLGRIPHIPPYLNPMRLTARYPTYNFKLIEATRRKSDAKFFTKNHTGKEK